MTLYYLTDEQGWYRNVISLCQQNCVSKCLRPKDAVVYTEAEMKNAKRFFERKHIRVFETEIIQSRKPGPSGKTWKKL